MKLVIFTSDENNGGIQQFMTTLARISKNLGHDTTVLMPNYDTIVVPKEISNFTIQYTKAKSINPYNKSAVQIADYINELNPDFVLIPEDAIFSMQVLLHLSTSIKTAFVIHDVSPHPSNMSFRRRMTLRFSMLMRRIGLKKIHRVVLLSKNNINRFKNHYPLYINKVAYLPLGAHVPHVDTLIKPLELDNSNSNQKYALFFGRIDKYKGISQLLNAFQSINDISLVIAGRGKFSDTEEYLINKLSNLIVINRFVTNEEMAWLFTNCKFVITPYIEASQSGVIPIAYHYSKPVIASKIDGLSEYVIDGYTGLLVSDVNELEAAISDFAKKDLTNYSINCSNYSKSNLNWYLNIDSLFNDCLNEKA